MINLKKAFFFLVNIIEINNYELSTLSVLSSTDKNNDADKVNYRPVSVLTCFSKMFERVLHDHMYDFAKLILSDSLSGFLKGHSCATALLKMTNDF